MSQSVHWIPREEKKKLLSFQADAELIERLNEFCDGAGISRSDFLRLAASNMLSKLS